MTEENKEIIAYMIHEIRIYGSPGETRRWAIFVDDYRNPDEKISGDVEWLLDQLQTGVHRGGRILSITPLYAGKPIFEDTNKYF